MLQKFCLTRNANIRFVYSFLRFLYSFFYIISPRPGRKPVNWASGPQKEGVVELCPFYFIDSEYDNIVEIDKDTEREKNLSDGLDCISA